MKPAPPLDALILTIREQKVILDADLAELFGVPTKALNQAVNRNAERFPEDFMFRLTAEEWDNLRSQTVTSSLQTALRERKASNRSQTVTGSHGGRRSPPYAFTEHGALQAANVLKSDRAVAMGVYVIRAFVQMREQLTTNAAIEKHLAGIDQKLLEHDEALVILWNKLKPLLAPPLPRPKPRIGF